MQSVSKRYISLQKDDIYFQKFLAKDGVEYGLRFGTPEDAKSISMIYKEIYDYQYLNPVVYNLEFLKRELSDKSNIWFVGELLENKEIAGIGLIEKERYIAHACRGAVRKKFQGLGVTTKIGAAGIITITKMPKFKDVLRLNSEVRGLKIGAQKLLKNSGALPYGLVPAYLNYGDKRKYQIDDNKPFPSQREEPAFLYSIIFKKLWKKREKNIYLLDNDDFIFFYEFFKRMSGKMSEDVLILENGKKNKNYELYGVSKDYYNGMLKLYGYIKEKSLNNLLKVYSDWRIIIWKIPTTPLGLSSMSLAIDKGFKVVGYDVGFSNMNWTLYDSVILVHYPKYNFDFLSVNSLDATKPLLNKVKDIFLRDLPD